MMDEKDYAKNL